MTTDRSETPYRLVEGGVQLFLVAVTDATGLAHKER